MAEEVQATEPVETIAAPVVEDLEAKVSALESEKARLIEEKSNYQVAYLKEHAKNKENGEEDADAKIRRIALEVQSESRLSEINREQDVLIKKALKENKELKLAIANKTDIPISTTSHTETTVAVKDTLVTPEQIAAFKARGWSEKDIERYKKNLRKNW